VNRLISKRQVLTRLTSVVAILVCSVGSACGAPDTKTTSPSGSTPNRVVMVYVAKSDATMDPWPTFAREIDPASGQVIGADVPLGMSHLVVGVGTGSVAQPPTPYVVVYSNDGTRLLKLGVGGPTTIYKNGAIGDDGRSVVDSQNRIYLSIGDRLVGIDGTSGESFMNVARPEAKIPARLDPGQSLPPGFGRTAAMLILPNGDLGVFVDNSYTSSLIDLQSGARLDTSYGYVEAATVGPDNLVYAVLLDPTSASNHLTLAQIDSSTMRLLRSVDLGVGLGSGLLLGMNLIPNSDGMVYIYGSESPSTSLPTSDAVGRFWRFDPSTLALTSLAVGNDLGYVGAHGVDGSIYFFAGTAGAAVTRFDPSKFAFVSAPFGSLGPSGSLVRAFFVL
jgi:hypothetical protein